MEDGDSVRHLDTDGSPDCYEHYLVHGVWPYISGYGTWPHILIPEHQKKDILATWRGLSVKRGELNDTIRTLQYIFQLEIY